MLTINSLHLHLQRSTTTRPDQPSYKQSIAKHAQLLTLLFMILLKQLRQPFHVPNVARSEEKIDSGDTSTASVAKDEI